MRSATTQPPFLQTSGAWQGLRKKLRAGHLAILIATVGIDIAALALPIFILQIYDRVLPDQTTMTLLVLVIGLGLALLVDITLRVLRRLVSSWTAVRLEHGLRVAAVDALLAASIPSFRGESVSVWIERVNAIAQIRDFEAAQNLEIKVDLCFAALYLGLIAYLGGLLALVPLTLLLLFCGGAIVMGQLLQDGFGSHNRADQARQASLLQLLRGIQTVKSLTLNQMVLRRHEQYQERSARSLQQVLTQTAALQVVTTTFVQVNSVALLSAGAVGILNGSMTVGAVAACTLLAGRAIQPIQTAINIWTNHHNIRIAKHDVAQLFSLPPEASTGAKRFEMSGKLELVGVTYTHAGAAQPLLDNVSLVLEPGHIIGIEGAPGTGKTTLLHLILGLLRPQSGKVLVDGEDITELSGEALRRQTALLSRNSAVYRGTIIDNLTNFRDGECVNEAMYVSFLLGADEAIRRMPSGFDQTIEASDALPAGLRQRIAIVRALATGPKIILFDEADIGLDHDSRSRLLDLLKDMSLTASVVMVSTHADILNLADRRFRLKAGRLIPVTAGGQAVVAEVAA